MKDMLNSLHDCYLDIANVSLSEVELKEMASKIPADIKHLAEQWGWFDTEVRDKLYLWLKLEYV